MKKIVIPGELITKAKKRQGYNSFKRDDGIYSTIIGLTDEEQDIIKVVPLGGKYMPREGDQIIGIVTGENPTGYHIELNSMFEAYVPKRNLRSRLRPGTMVQAKIMRVSEVNEADLGYVRGLPEGDFLKVKSSRVPRIIGKGASMINMLKDYAGGSISIGKNGFIWAKGTDLALLKKTLEKIENESHTSNLTNRVKEFLEKQKGKPKEKTEGE